MPLAIYFVFISFYYVCTGQRVDCQNALYFVKPKSGIRKATKNLHKFLFFLEKTYELPTFYLRIGL